MDYKALHRRQAPKGKPPIATTAAYMLPPPDYPIDTLLRQCRFPANDDDDEEDDEIAHYNHSHIKNTVRYMIL
jgi:hypothetical protein